MQISVFTKALVAVTFVAVPLAAQPGRGESATMLRDQAFSSVLDWPSYSPAMRVFLAALGSAPDVSGPNGPGRLVDNGRSGLAASGWGVSRPNPDVPAGRGFVDANTPVGSGRGFVNPPDNYVITTTPEPATMALLATGLLVMGAITLRSRRARKV